MTTPQPNPTAWPMRKPLVAPGSFRRAILYRFKGVKSKPKRPARALPVMEQGLDAYGRKSQATNVCFRYLYRDASNYKQHGEAIFTNRTFLPLETIETQLCSSLKDGKFFIARQVNIEERFFDALHDDDHPWHEYDRLEVTTQGPFDPAHWDARRSRRDITELLADFDKARQAGWDEMNVRPDLQRLLEEQKQHLRRKLEE